MCGATQTGKTQFANRLLESDLFKKPHSKIVYPYLEYQSTFDAMRGVTFHQGLPIALEIDGYATEYTILVLNDLMLQITTKP